jgi:hypothetical protein
MLMGGGVSLIRSAVMVMVMVVVMMAVGVRLTHIALGVGSGWVTMTVGFDRVILITRLAVP